LIRELKQFKITIRIFKSIGMINLVNNGIKKPIRKKAERNKKSKPIVLKIVLE
jgi:hypothetical protein